MKKTISSLHFICIFFEQKQIHSEDNYGSSLVLSQDGSLFAYLSANDNAIHVVKAKPGVNLFTFDFKKRSANVFNFSGMVYT
jgi:hypothetical protein